MTDITSNPVYDDTEDGADDEETPILSVNDSPGTPYKQNATRYVYFLSLFSAIGGFLFGYDTGVISGAMIPLKKELSLSSQLQELVVSITVGGALLGAISSGYLNHLFGRRAVLLIASFVFTVGAIFMAATPSVIVLIFGRLTVGLGIGYASSTVPIYIAEVAPANIRGQLVTMYQLFITLGVFLASLLNGAFSYMKHGGWRYMLGVSGVPSFVMFVGLFFMPESPRWLIDKGHVDKARKVLSALRGRDDIEEELHHIQSANAESKQRGSTANSLLRAFATPSVRRALILGCGLQAFQQLCGINTIIYYSATIIELSGVRDQSTIIWLAAVVAGCNFIFTLITVLIVEKISRRKLTLYSILGVCFALCLLSVSFAVLKNESPKATFSVPSEYTKNCISYKSCYACVEDTSCGFCFIQDHGKISNGSCLAINKQLRNDQSSFCNASTYDVSKTGKLNWFENICPTSVAWLIVTAMIFYLAMFACGLGPMPWAINAEIYPLWARSVGLSASAATNWTFNLLISLTFLDIFHLLTHIGAFLLYAGITFIGFIFLYILLPETKGKKLEEVEKLFEGPVCVPCRKC